MISWDHTFIVAEIGLNHNGTFETAKQCVEAAAEAGCDGVKFQNFVTEDFIQDETELFTYLSQGKEITEPIYAMFKRNEFKREWLQPLKAFCDKIGLEFISTPTSKEGVEDLSSIGCSFVKNGSDCLTHLPLISEMGKSKMTVILSTGMAEKKDIDAAIQAAGNARSEKLILLHCTSSYPTGIKDANLRKIIKLRNVYHLPVGFSDHTQGWLAAVQAVSLGAVLIEKHFTLDHNLPGPDHWFSSTPKEMAKLVSEVRKAEIRLGSDCLKPSESELENRDAFRIGVVADRDLAKGHFLTKEDVAFRRPCHGILPKDLDQYLGLKLRNPLAKNTSIRSEDLIS